MTNHELDLEQIIEIEYLEQQEDPALVPADHYGIDVEDPYCGYQPLSEVDLAIDEIREDSQLDHLEHSCITKVDDAMEIFKVHDDSPKIIRYLKDH